MKEINNLIIIKSKTQRNEVFSDLKNEYARESELSVSIMYDSTIMWQSSLKYYVTNPEETPIENLPKLINTLEKDLPRYNGKIFIYTNAKEKTLKELFKFLKITNFGPFKDNAGNEENARIFYVFCDE